MGFCRTLASRLRAPLHNGFLVASSRHYYRRPLPPACISFCSSEGKHLFKEALDAGHMDCYFELAAQFRTQDEPAFCGLTSLVIVLNALAIDPQQVWKGVWRWYHEDMLECCVSKSSVLTAGITLGQFACLAECNGLKATTVWYTPGGLERFRTIVKTITQQDKQFLIASYSRAHLQQSGDGHFSPIAGYHPGRDLVLVLDTARFKYPPHWMSLSSLYDAMEPPDLATGRPRGYCIMKKNEGAKASLFNLAGPLAAVGSIAEPTTLHITVRAWLSRLASPSASTALSEPHDLVAAFLTTFSQTDLSHFLCVGNSTVSAMTSPSACLYDNIGHWNFLVRGVEQTAVFRACDRLLEDPMKDGSSGGGVMSFVRQTRDEIKRTMLWCKNRSGCSSSEHYAKASRLAAILRPAHTLAMLLLSWPYEEMSTATGDVSLHCRMSSAIAAQDNIVLSSEVATLRAKIVVSLGSLLSLPAIAAAEESMQQNATAVGANSRQ